MLDDLRCLHTELSRALDLLERLEPVIAAWRSGRYQDQPAPDLCEISQRWQPNGAADQDAPQSPVAQLLAAPASAQLIDLQVPASA